MHAEMVLIDNNWCTVQNARQVDVCDGWRRTLTHRRRHLCAVGSSFTRLSAKRCQNVAIYSAMSSGQNECTFVFVSVRTTAVSHRRVVQQTAAVRNRAAENNVNLHILISSCWWSLRGGVGGVNSSLLLGLCPTRGRQGSARVQPSVLVFGLLLRWL